MVKKKNKKKRKKKGSIEPHEIIGFSLGTIVMFFVTSWSYGKIESSNIPEYITIGGELFAIGEGLAVSIIAVIWALYVLVSVKVFKNYRSD